MGRDFDGSVVLVTGSSRGIGRAVARAFLDEGARVLLHGRDAAGLERARAELGVPAGDALCADLARPAEIDALFDAVAALGGLDVLVNNAGVALSGPFERHEPAALADLLSINVRAAERCGRRALALMAPRGRGLIIDISSNVATAPLPLLAAYSASKAALEALALVLRDEAAPRGVQVMVVAPGAVDTDIGLAEDPEFDGRFNRGIVRLRPEAVAVAVLCACRLARAGSPRSLVFEHAVARLGGGAP
jgi:NAD(P)-dependent dehydrogenase (short-subunit alcohol dehydrogenase family)